MLSRRSASTADSKDQKLFNLIVSHYLNTENSVIEPFTVPADLLPSVKVVNAVSFAGTNYITYIPEQVFSPFDLAKLNDLKSQFYQIKKEIASRKQALGLESDEEIIAAHKTYMNRLHRYNEAKDMAQALMGRLAQLTGKTTKDLYPDFNLSLED